MNNQEKVERYYKVSDRYATWLKDKKSIDQVLDKEHEKIVVVFNYLPTLSESIKD